MPRRAFDVVCIGSLAIVDLWRVTDPMPIARFSMGDWQGSIIGNDAVIVARELLRRRVPVGCILLAPTDGDIAVAQNSLPRSRIRAISKTSGECTRSLCLEDALGHRSWIFSRCQQPSGGLGDITASIVYVDYYNEFASYLNQRLHRSCRDGAQLIVNFSAIRSLRDIEAVSFRPAIAQASVSNEFSLREARQCALRLAEKTAAQRAVITLGARGAVLAVSGQTWHSEPTTKRRGSVLGAGAVLSSELILALISGLEGDTLLERAVNRTSLRLKKLAAL